MAAQTQSETSETHVGLGGYIATWAGLMILTGLTFGLSFVSLGAWGMPIAILIAGTKVLLVVLVFMHLIEHGATPRLAAVAGVSLLVLLCSLTILDAAVRQDDAVPEQLSPPGTWPPPQEAP